MRTYFIPIVGSVAALLAGAFFWLRSETVPLAPPPSTVGVPVLPAQGTLPIPDVVSVPYFDGLVLAIGQTGTYQGLTLSLNAVSGDSRCPIDVTCIVAGAVTANITLSVRGQARMLDILSDGAPLYFGGYEVSIAGVDPAPRAGQTIPSAAYRIRFRIISLMGKG